MDHLVLEVDELVGVSAFLGVQGDLACEAVSLRTVGARLLPDDAFEAAASWVLPTCLNDALATEVDRMQKWNLTSELTSMA